MINFFARARAAQPILAALVAAFAQASPVDAQPADECAATEATRPLPEAAIRSRLGIAITAEMLRCAGGARSTDPVTGEDSIDFLLAMGPDRIGPGIAAPPAQRLRVPVNHIDPANWSAPQTPTDAIRTSGVSLRVPLEADGAVLALSVGITAAGWQERARASSDPEFGGRPGWRKQPPDASGLQRLVAIDPTKTEDRFGDAYVVNDDELGFVQAYCSGLPDRPRLDCSVAAELTPYLVVTVRMPEPQLGRWRELTSLAHETVRKLIVQP